MNLNGPLLKKKKSNNNFHSGFQDSDTNKGLSITGQSVLSITIQLGFMCG